MRVAGGTGPVKGVAAMAWSIAEVVRMSGVTSRTLRHYDEIGLLPPAGVAHHVACNGRVTAAS